MSTSFNNLGPNVSAGQKTVSQTTAAKKQPANPVASGGFTILPAAPEPPPKPAPPKTPEMTAAEFLRSQELIQLNKIPYTNVKLEITDKGINFTNGNGSKAITMKFGKTITMEELEAKLATIKPNTPESAFFPFIKNMIKSFYAIDRFSIGRINTYDLKLFASLTGGVTNTTITATDFKSVEKVSYLSFFEYKVNANGTVKLQIPKNSKSIELPGQLSVDNLNTLLQSLDIKDPYYPIVHSLANVAFSNNTPLGSTVSVLNFANKLYTYRLSQKNGFSFFGFSVSESGAITPEAFYTAISELADKLTLNDAKTLFSLVARPSQ